MTGVLLIDKPKDYTSFDVVAVVRKLCREKKCGHCGTLDPMATGVMTVMLGGATRFSELLPSHDKAYEATLKLGITTDTLDITGNITSEKECNVSAVEFGKAAESFVGEITQIPPMYSAVSVEGQRLYDLARKGIEVERPERKVSIYRLDVLNSDEKNGEYRIYAECSSGTYIRTLISDIGEKLGCGATLTELRRVKANGFTIDECFTLEDLKEAAEAGKIADCLIPVDIAAKSYPEIKVSAAQAVRFHNGGELFASRLSNCKVKGLYRVYSPEDVFLGLGEYDGDELLTVRRVFNMT